MATVDKSADSKSKTQQTPQRMRGAEILVEAMVRQGVDTVFAYPGGASMPMHQALSHKTDKIRTILPRHEQGGSFAAAGYARTTGKPGVCLATSGPGATNLITGIADAKMDSIPLIAITGQVPQQVIGTDAFQETPIVEVCRAVTKHHYMITKFEDIPRIVKEAFHIATTGRPGPVLIDFPKNIQLQDAPVSEINFDPPMHLPGYNPIVKGVSSAQIRQVVAAIKRAKRPVLYVGGGAISSAASEELIKFAKHAKIPVTMTLMGLGAFPGSDKQSLHMLGMHGTVYANWAVDESDLLLAFGVRFDDRVTGKLTEFAKHGKIVHVDNDASEIHKNKEAHIPIIADLREFLVALNAGLEGEELPNLDDWWKQIEEWRAKYPLKYKSLGEDLIMPQAAIEELYRQTKSQDVCLAVGVGQHQMWAAQFYKFDKPRRWMSSSGLGSMGFGLPAAMGAQAAHPDKLCIDIDGDGSFLMNVQELATCYCEKLPVKVFLLNNQHLGMVVQWENLQYQGNRAHTYLGPIDRPEAKGKGSGAHEELYPDFVKMAQSFGVEAAHVSSLKELPAAITKMLKTPGPYVLDILCPYQEHVLPMIPGGKTAKEIIIDEI